MKKDRVQQIFLEQLRRVPIIEVCCEKANISRMSIHRWRKESREFDRAVIEAMAVGDAFVSDLSESQLISLIKDKYWPAISFWLRARNPKFRERLEVTARVTEKREAMTPEEREAFRKALHLAPLIAGKPPPAEHVGSKEADNIKSNVENNNDYDRESKQQ